MHASDRVESVYCKVISPNTGSIPDYRKDCETCLPQCNDVEYNINIEDGKMDNVGYDSDIT